MKIPEIILYKALNGIIKLVTDDYNVATDKTKTILNDLFAKDDNGLSLQIENLDYLTQAINLITRTNENSRRLSVNIGYNQAKSNMPTIHIVLPRDMTGRYNAIGHSYGEFDVDYDQANSQEVGTKVNSYRTTFYLLITSDNVSEVLILYYFFKSMLIFVDETFELQGLHNLHMSGEDVQLEQQFGPDSIFHRNLTVEFDYQDEIKVRIAKDFASQLNLIMCSDIPLNTLNAAKG